MKRYSHLIILGVALLLLSVLLYFIHFLIFRDTHHIFIYMVGDLAFLPLDIFLVIVVIERILARREKALILQKLNMVVGAFYSEVGTELMQKLLDAFQEHQQIRQNFNVRQEWDRNDFRRAINRALGLQSTPDPETIDLEELRLFLMEKRQFLLALLENPNLLEHDRFTDLLWATFHLAEELEARRTVKDLPDKDVEHLAGDITRLYGYLVAEWLEYTEYIKPNYPFLFSLMVRTHPFQENPSAVIAS